MMHEDMSRNYTFMITKAVDFVNNYYPEILNSEYSIRLLGKSDCHFCLWKG